MLTQARMFKSVPLADAKDRCRLLLRPAHRDSAKAAAPRAGLNLSNVKRCNSVDKEVSKPLPSRLIPTRIGNDHPLLDRLGPNRLACSTQLQCDCGHRNTPLDPAFQQR